MKRKFTLTIGLVVLALGIAVGTTNSLFSGGIAKMMYAPAVTPPQEGPDTPSGPTPADPPSPVNPTPVEPPTGGDDPSEPADEYVIMDYSSLLTEGDAAKIKWYTSKKFPFSIDGDRAISSNQGQPSSISWMEAELDLDGNYNLSLKFDVSTSFAKTGEYSWNHDTGRILIDGNTIESVLDEISKSVTKELEQGHHKVRIEYSKDELGDFKDDCMAVSDIKLIALPNDFNQLCGGDSSFTFTLPDDGCTWSCYHAIAKPKNIGLNDSEASFDINVTGEGLYSVVFDYEILSEENKDEFMIYVDNNLEFTESGRQTGKFIHVFPQGGSHVIRCDYVKDPSDNGAEEYLNVTSLRKYDYEFKEDIRTYKVVAHTPFDDNLQFSLGSDNAINYSSQFKYYDNGDVVINSLMDFPNKNIEQYPIRAHLNEDGNILFENITAPGMEVVCGKRLDITPQQRMVLYAGSLSAEGFLYPDDHLMLQVSPDKSTVAVPGGFGYGSGMVHVFYTDAYFTTSDGSSLIWSSEKIDVPNIHKGDSKVININVTNSGMGDALCTVSDGSSDYVTLEYDDTFSLRALGERKSLSVTVNGLKEGWYSLPLRITADNGNEMLVTLKGEILPELDYNDIVSKGKGHIEWSSSSEYPWDVLHATAFSTNHGATPSQSWLQATFDIPADHVGIIKGDVKYSIGSENTFTISNGEEKWETFSNLFFYSENEEKFEKHLFSGHYDVRFNYDKTSSVAQYYSDEASLSNLSLVIVEYKEDGVWIEDESADFGTVETGNTSEMAIALTNVGRNDLKVVSIEGDGIFSGIVPDQSASTFEDLEVTLTCNAPQDGIFSGQVLLKTNAGDITIKCKAESKNRLSIGNGQQICFSYPFDPSLFSDEVVTQSLYKDSRLASLKDCKIQSLTFSLIDYATTETNWEEGEMTWEVGTYEAESLIENDEVLLPDGLTTVYNGGMLNFKDKELTVIFDEPITWDGSDRIMYRLSIKDCPIKSGFLYTRGSATDYVATTQTSNNGTCRKESMVPDIRIEYQLPSGPGVGVLEIMDSEVVETHYFNLEGVEISHPDHGIYIEVNTHRDGRVTSRKIHAK